VARQLARRQQRERIVGVLVVCLGFAVLAVALVALHEPNGHAVAAQSQSGSASSVAQESPSHPHRRAAHPHVAPSSTAPAPSVTSVPLVVLNNTTIQGLAASAAQRFEAGGWTVTSYGNYQNDILSTCAYFDPADPLAKAAAKALRRQFPTIKRVVPKFPELPSGPVVVVLTPDYSPT
jgi:hypothetical protein